MPSYMCGREKKSSYMCGREKNVKLYVWERNKYLVISVEEKKKKFFREKKVPNYLCERKENVRLYNYV